MRSNARSCVDTRDWTYIKTRWTDQWTTRWRLKSTLHNQANECMGLTLHIMTRQTRSHPFAQTRFWPWFCQEQERQVGCTVHLSFENVSDSDRRQASHCLMTCWQIFWRNLAVFFPADWSSGFTCCRYTMKKKETQIYWTQNGPCPWFCTRNFKTLNHRLAKAARHQHFGTRGFFSFLSIFPKVIVKNGSFQCLGITFWTLSWHLDLLRRAAVIMPMRA